MDTIFSLRQLQEKCREQQQQQPLFLPFVDLTKPFDLVSRSRLFKILQKIDCPPKLLAIITSFHQDMQSTGLLRWSHLQCHPSQQWSKAGLCPCSNPVRDFLLDAPPVCLCRLHRKGLRPDEIISRMPRLNRPFFANFNFYLTNVARLQPFFSHSSTV